MPSETEIVAGLMGKPWAMVSKGELARKVLNEMNVIKALTIELYCVDSRNKMFDGYPEEGVKDLEKERTRRQGGLLKRAFKIFTGKK